MRYFAGDVGTPISNAIEGAEKGSEILFYGLVIFGLMLLSLVLTMFLLGKKFGKNKGKDYIDLP